MERRSGMRALVGVVALAATAAAGAEEKARATLGEDGVQRIEIVGGSYYFEPAHVVVEAGVPVELTVRYGSGFMPHNFTLRSAELGVDVSVGLRVEPRTVTFTPQAVGEYTFTCDRDPPFFASHAERGMTGVLEVVE